MSITVYSSTDASAPVLTGEVGKLTALLQACLVDGYGSKAAAGWTMPYTGTNKAVFRSANVATQRHYFRINDTAPTTGAAKEAGVVGYVTMSDVDTGTEPFPTAAQYAFGQFIVKSITANSTARAWTLIADDATCYIWIANGTNILNFGFGHFESYKAGDAYNSFVAGGHTTNTVAPASIQSAVMSGHNALTTAVAATSGRLCVPRIIAQTGTAAIAATMAQGLTTANASCVYGYCTTATGWHGFTAPASNADGAFYLHPIYVVEITGGLVTIRGRLPGQWNAMHAYGTVTSGATSSGVAGFPGRSFYHIDLNGAATNGSGVTGQSTTDITGPWW